MFSIKTYTALFVIPILFVFVGSSLAKTHQYALATAHPLATQAGYEVLREGGNAFDAAVVVSAMLAVVEPYGSGFGGGGFWLLHQAKEQSNIVIDGRETAPLAASADMYLDANGKPIENLSVNGALAAGIPGMPAAIVHLAERYGSLPLSRLLLPAIKVAEEGFYADDNFIKYAKLRKDILQQSPHTRKNFLINGNIPTTKDLIKQHDLANTIKRIAQYGKDGFYRGVVAEEMVNYVRRKGGIWKFEDLSTYSVIERKPIRFKYHNVDIVSVPPPSSGGIVMQQIFNILSEFDLSKMSSVQQTHHIIEAMRLAYHDRSLWLGDSDFVEIPSYLTKQSYASQLAKTIRADKATISKHLTNQRKGTNTTHFSIIDAHGNRVAATLSINYPFGSGLIAGSTGVVLNNEMDDFAIASGVANLYGLTGEKANAIAPKKRMLSSMSPTFVDDGQRVMVLGTPGGSRIITMIVLGIMQFLDGASTKMIVSEPRYHHQYLPDVIVFESKAFDDYTQKQLGRLGHTLSEHQSMFGNMQIVIHDKLTNTITAHSDPRGIGLSKTSARKK